MNVPSFLVGEYKAVKPRARKAARALLGESSVAKIEGELLRWETVPGFFVLNGPSPLLRGEHFQAFAILRAIDEEASALAAKGRLPDRSRVRAAIFGLTRRTWGLATLLSPVASGLLFDLERHAQLEFLRTVAASWEELESIGRYSMGLERAESFEDVAVSIAGILYRLGDRPPSVDSTGRPVERPPVHGRLLKMLAAVDASTKA